MDSALQDMKELIADLMKYNDTGEINIPGNTYLSFLKFEIEKIEEKLNVSRE